MRVITFTLSDADHALIDTQRRRHHFATMAAYVRWKLLSAVPEADALPIPMAAPDLLEALEYLETAARRLADGSEPMSNDYVLKLAQKARATISKAKGK